MSLTKLLAFLLLASAAFGANATPVTISSTTVSGTTVTVNTSAAHGLSAANGGQAACLSAPSNVCGVVLTTPTTVQFTLQVGTGPAACASSCGTSQPAPQIIVLQTQAVSHAEVSVTYALWITTTQPCPGPGSSSWKVANGSVGSTAAQNAALSAGIFVELVRSKTLPANTTTGQLQVLLQNDYAEQQAAMATNIQPCQVYGQVWDGTGWAKQ